MAASSGWTSLPHLSYALQEIYKFSIVYRNELLGISRLQIGECAGDRALFIPLNEH